LGLTLQVRRGGTESRYMPLPSGTFGGEDLTMMEFRIFEGIMKQKAERKAAWDLSKPVIKDETSTAIEGYKDVQDPESASSTMTVVETTPVIGNEVVEDNESFDGESFVDASDSLPLRGMLFPW
jgi:hypothetical protein